MYVLGAGETRGLYRLARQPGCVNEFYFTDWQDSYAEAFGDRSARGVIAVAVFREVPAPAPVYQSDSDAKRSIRPRSAGALRERADGEIRQRRRDESPGTGYGDRRVDHAVQVEFIAQSVPDSRHFIKYEWRETLCRKQLVACADQNRFWNESMVGFAPPPPRH